MRRFTDSDRKKVLDQLIADESEIIHSKGREYTNGAEADNELDTLENFRKVGDLVKHKCSSCGLLEPIGPTRALAVYYMKQAMSILSYCSDPSRAGEMSESIHSRVLDARVYPMLLECIHEASRESEHETASPVPLSISED